MMLIYENENWKVICDVCKTTKLEVKQTRSCVGDEPRWSEISDLLDINHYYICDAHKFNHETGDWIWIEKHISANENDKVCVIVE